ncbi:MAG TPA: nucleotidyltransferase domain-containing protein [Thermoanaerobaculia bacterium]|nr:nucleotidyltransferase domain-containing protein [Thermoanaerobaculia bacterium]
MEIQPLLTDLVERVKRVQGVRAIVLGGSRARGTHTPKSDIDLGIYYHPDQPLDLQALDQASAELDDRHQPGLLTPIGGWGPWINGGGWLTVQGQPVDFLYRDLGKVSACIEACCAGEVEMVYQPGHPHGFSSSIYMAEVAACQILWEADGQLSALKERTDPYPEPLKLALIQKFGWEMGFSLMIARKAIERGDVAYVAGCCFRCVGCLLQVVFALNGQYWMNEKGAVALADTFLVRPAMLRGRIEKAFTLLAADRLALTEAIAVLDEVKRDTDLLATPRTDPA